MKKVFYNVKNITSSYQGVYKSSLFVFLVGTLCTRHFNVFCLSSGKNNSLLLSRQTIPTELNETYSLFEITRYD